MTTIPISLPVGFAYWPAHQRAAWCDAELFRLLPPRRFLARAPLRGEFDGRPGGSFTAVIVDGAAGFKRHGVDMKYPSKLAGMSDDELLRVVIFQGYAV